MTLLKAALLDDNKEQLQKNQHFLEKAGLVTVVTACISAETFLKEVKQSQPDILFLDLNLGDSYMTGMEVANELKLPVLFASSNTYQFVKEIESLKRNFTICVDHITKPFTEEEFIKTTQRFLREVAFFSNEEYVFLDFGTNKRNKIAIDSIVYLEADKAHGSLSNNKIIYFNNRKVEKLIDFSFTRMEEKGFFKTRFITIHKSIRVNHKHIKFFDKKEEVIEVDVFNSNGKIETKRLPVSENYLSDVKQFRGS